MIRTISKKTKIGISLITAMLIMYICCVPSLITAQAAAINNVDVTIVADNDPTAAATGGTAFVDWITTVLTEYAWAISLIMVPVTAIVFFLSGREAAAKGKSLAFNIVLGIFVLSLGNTIIQAARSSFGG